jgi:hypothetical protein
MPRLRQNRQEKTAPEPTWFVVGDSRENNNLHQDIYKSKVLSFRGGLGNEDLITLIV